MEPQGILANLHSQYGASVPAPRLTPAQEAQFLRGCDRLGEDAIDRAKSQEIEASLTEMLEEDLHGNGQGRRLFVS